MINVNVGLDSDEEVLLFIEFLPFFKAQVKELARHQPEKGDSWKTMPIMDLRHLLADAIEGFALVDENTVDQLVDLANFEAMLWKRREELE